MAVNKNFVVKNGLEVNTQLILADANTNKVGIGSTAPRFELDVAGGIGATDSYVSGISTVFSEFNVGTDGSVLTVLGVGGSVGVGTAIPEYLLDIRSPVSTGQTALYVQGDVKVTGDLSVDDITFDQADINNLNVTGIATISQLGVTNSTSTTNLTVTGISTFDDYIDINDNVDISGTLNVGGATTLTGYVDINNSLDVSVDVNVGGLTTLGGYVDINDNVDISADLNVVGIATIATVDINAGDINVSNIESTNLNVTGIATIGSVSIAGAALSTLTVSQSTELNNLNVTGISTLGIVEISLGIVTATSGIVTYYGDGRYLDLSGNPTTGIGIGIATGNLGFGVTFIDLRGSGVSTSLYESSVGIATIFFEGGGSGTIGIGTIFPVSPAPSNGDLFFNANYGRIFVYYDENIIGVGTDEYWVDAAPFNVGSLDVADLILNTLSVSNIGTVTKLHVGVPTTFSEDLVVTGDARVTGILTVGSSSVTIDGLLNKITVGSGVTIDGNTGIITATTIKATNFIGDGSGLTGAGSTVSDDTTTNSTFYPLFTSTTSGTVTDSKVSTTKLSFNPSTGTLTVTGFSGNGSGLTSLNASNISSGTINDAYLPATISSDITGNAATATDATNFNVTANNSTNETVYPVFVDGATGNQGAETDTALSYNPSTNILTAGTFSGSGANLTNLNASNISSGTIPGDRGVTAGSATASFVEYNGTTKTAGQFDGGTTNPSNTTRLNYDGYLYATRFYGDGSGLSGAGSTVSNETGTNASFYPLFTQTTSGIVTSSFVSTSQLSFNPSTGTLNSSLISGTLTNYSEKINVIGNTGSSPNINLANGNYVTATLDQTATFTFTTGITTGAVGFALALTNGSGGPFSITWPVSVKWPNNSTPIRTTTDGKTDVWVFTTPNNGTTWYGNLALYNFS